MRSLVLHFVLCPRCWLEPVLHSRLREKSFIQNKYLKHFTHISVTNKIRPEILSYLIIYFYNPRLCSSCLCIKASLEWKAPHTPAYQLAGSADLLSLCTDTWNTFLRSLPYILVSSEISLYGGVDFGCVIYSCFLHSDLDLVVLDSTDRFPKCSDMNSCVNTDLIFLMSIEL